MFDLTFFSVFAFNVFMTLATLFWMNQNPKQAVKFLIWVTFGREEKMPVVSWKHALVFYVVMGVLYAPLMILSFWATVASFFVSLIIMSVWSSPLNHIIAIIADKIITSIQTKEAAKASAI